MQHVYRPLALIAALTLVACGDSDSEPADSAADAGNNVDSGSGSDAGGTAEYPAGPYGINVGDVIANLAFVDPDGNPVTLADLRTDGVRALYINTAAGWCTACREEQPEIQALYEARADDGLLVVVTYFEDNEFNPAEPAEAAQWAATYALTFPVLADPEFVTSAYYDEAQTPMNLVIDVDSMRIGHISTGVNLDEVESVIGLILDR